MNMDKFMADITWGICDSVQDVRSIPGCFTYSKMAVHLRFSHLPLHLRVASEFTCTAIGLARLYIKSYNIIVKEMLSCSHIKLIYYNPRPQELLNFF